MNYLIKEKKELKNEIEEVKKEVVKKENKKEEKHRYVVVKELPVEVIRESISKDGNILHYITIEEALFQVMNT